MSSTRKVVYRHGRRIEVIETIPDQPQRKPSTPAKFVKIPTFWIEKLAGESAAVYALGLLVLLLDFENYGRPVKLSNKHLKMAAETKRRSLRRLAELGLISVEFKTGSAPLVTVIRCTIH
jgi:hypothetical protein